LRRIGEDTNLGQNHPGLRPPLERGILAIVVFERSGTNNIYIPLEAIHLKAFFNYFVKWAKATFYLNLRRIDYYLPDRYW
jgi:hypothetical protein